MTRNERGSASFYAIWMLSLTMILMLLIVSVIKIYAAKEQASLSAEQAALAATDVVYDAVNEVIDDYKGPILENVDDDDKNDLLELGGKKFREQIEDKKKELQNQGLYKSQAKMEAIDIVLLEKIQEPEYKNLKKDIEDALRNISDDVESVADRVVSDNNGEASETTIYFFNNENRIEVRTKSSFEEVQYQSFFKGISGDVPQKAVGPKIEFISNIDWVDVTIQ